MRILRAVHLAMADLYHLFLAPLRDDETPLAVTAPPMWVRAAIGWAVVVGGLAGVMSL